MLHGGQESNQEPMTDKRHEDKLRLSHSLVPFTETVVELSAWSTLMPLTSGGWGLYCDCTQINSSEPLLSRVCQQTRLQCMHVYHLGFAYERK